MMSADFHHWAFSLMKIVWRNLEFSSFLFVLSRNVFYFVLASKRGSNTTLAPASSPLHPRQGCESLGLGVGQATEKESSNAGPAWSRNGSARSQRGETIRIRLPSSWAFSVTGTVLTFILLMPNGLSENIIVAAHSRSSTKGSWMSNYRTASWKDENIVLLR